MYRVDRSLALALVTALSLAACTAQPGADPSASPTTTTAGADESTTPEIELPEGVNDPSELEPTEVETIAFDTSTIVPDGTVSADGKVTKDISKWTLPTDPYIGLTHIEIFNGEQAFVESCLKQQGITETFTPAKQHVDAQFPDTNLTSNTPIFNVEVAKRQGYGIGDTARKMEVPLHDRLMQLQTTNENDLLDKFATCSSQFEEKYGWQQKYYVPNDNYSLPVEEAMAKEPTYAQNRFQVGVTTPERDKALADWKACMEPVIPGKVPDYPLMMPTYEFSEEWSKVDPATGQYKGITQDQIDLAVKDAECRDSSGYTRTIYDETWSLLQQYVNDHQAQLDERVKAAEGERAQIEELKAAVQ